MISRRGLALAALIGASAALGFMPVARAGGGTLSPGTEGWYQPNPSCLSPVGCVTPDTLPVTPPVAVPTSPFTAGTMHIGWAVATETARAYLVFPFETLTGTPTSALLDVPLDTAPSDGDLQSATAKVQVCPAIGSIDPVEGGIDNPPGVDCSSHAAMTYVATPSPHLHADLSPMLKDLISSTGLALLPDATANGPTDAWRVVFSAHNRTDAAKTPPATLTVVTGDQPVEQSSEPPAVDVPPVDVPAGTVLQPGLMPGLPPVEQSAAPVPVPTVGQPVAAARTVTVGYAYPVVWLLPLILLVVVPLATRSLTKDLAPAQEAAARV